MLTDQNGAIVPGATVTARNDRTGEERSTTSTTEGTYLITNLKPSTYTVTVSAPSLSATATNAQVLVGEELKLNLTLKPSGVSATVDVTSGADASLTTESASMNVSRSRG